MNIFKNKIEKTLDFVESLGSKNIKHAKGLSLFEHLKRVKDILEKWELDETTLLAGLCHSLYSTEYFKYNLLNTNDRDNLKKEIGEDAERIVYYFSILNRENVIYIEEEKSYQINASTPHSRLLHLMDARNLEIRSFIF